MRSLIFQSVLAICLVLLAACAEEVPPRTAADFIKNPIMLEAAIVRCRRDLPESKYEAECVNARKAVRQIEVKQEAIRRKEWEAQSERKRLALRRAQEAAMQARQRHADEETRLREEAEYLAMFGELPPTETTVTDDGQVIETIVRPLPVANDSEMVVLPTEDIQAAGTDSGPAISGTDQGDD